MKNRFTNLCRGLALTMVLAAGSLAARAQSVGIGTTAPDASAALDIVSTSKGALLPRVALATSIASPATGLIVFQTGGTAGYYYNAGDATTPNWQQIATAAGAAITASNGLTKTGQNIALGGALTGATNVPLGGNNLTFSGTGNVGIGGSGVPATTLDVTGTVQARSSVVADGSGGNTGTTANILRFGGLGSSEGIGSKRNATGNLNGLDFYTSATNRLSITNGGNVGIGTTTPLVPLSVSPGSLGPKLTLWDAASTTQHYGFGISADQLNYQVQGTASHVFSKQGKNNDGIEMMRLQGTTGNLGIGTNTPAQRLHVVGNALITGLAGTTSQLIQADASGNLGLAPSLFPASASVPTLASTTTGLNNPLVAVSGTLAVVLNRGANSLSLYDLTNPASPVLRGTLTDASLANGVEVAISGTTAAVLCNTLNGNTGTGSGTTNDIGLVRLFMLGATAPVLVNTLVPPAALSAVNGGLAMSGTKLYVVYDRGASTGYFYVYDVTTPATTSSTPQGTGFPAGGGFTPQSLAVAGNFVAVGSLYNGASVMNVSNPAAPTVAGSTGFTGYTAGNDCPVALTTSTLCVLNPVTALLSTYILSAAGVPTLRNTFTTAATPVSVALNGNLALVACRVSGANVLQVIDVSGSTAVLRNTIALTATTNNVVLTPTLALVANGSAANNLQIFNTPFGARTVVVGPDGALTTTPPTAGVDYVQNQTATAQTAGFSVSGNGTVGGLLAAGSASVGGAITGTGSSIGGVGVGIRADGGLNLGQNTLGNSIYLGSGAGGGISGGSGRNTFLGYEAGLNGGTASNNNTFLGYRAGYNGGGGSFNIYLGGFSGYTNGGGSSNVFVGYNGGYHNTSGSKNTTLGDNSGPAPGSGNLTNATALGADVYLSQSNTVVLGNAASVGIGTSAPTQKLEVAGTVYSTSGGFKFPDGTTQTTAAAAPNLTGDITSTGAATTYANVVPATKGGAGSVNGILKANGSGTVAAAVAGTDYAAATGSTAYIQNQTASAQTGGFNVGGAGTVGGLLTAAAGAAVTGNATVSGTLGVGGTTAPTSTLQSMGSTAVAVANGLVGVGGTGQALGDRGYVGLSPAGGADYYLLPTASSCPGRIYYLRNNSTTNTAYLGTGTGTNGGSIFEGGNQTAVGLPFFMLTSGLTKTVTIISDGLNWTLIKGGN